MKIEFKGCPISTIEDWQNVIFTGSKAKHWKEGRSAHALADFMLNKGGEMLIRELIATSINEKFTLDSAYPEYQVRFDNYNNGRVHDLGLFGQTNSGKKIFVGVEAKVDETFGSTVKQKYLTEKIKELNGVSTNAPKRIEQLLKFNFEKVSREDFDHRYQLLHATSGTLSVEADIHIFMVLVFKTDDYKNDIGKANYADFLRFVKRTEALNFENGSYKLNRAGSELFIIYKAIENQ